MPKAKDTYQEKPWYKRSNSWAWIVTGACVLAFIIIMAMDSAAEKKAKADAPKAEPKVKKTATVKAEVPKAEPEAKEETTAAAETKAEE